MGTKSYIAWVLLCLVLLLVVSLNVFHFYDSSSMHSAQGGHLADQYLSSTQVDILNQSLKVLRLEIAKSRNRNVVDQTSLKKEKLDEFSSKDVTVSAERNYSSTLSTNSVVGGSIDNHMPAAIPQQQSPASSSTKRLSAEDSYNNNDKGAYVPPKRPRRFVIFTMDSIASYEQNSRSGGAAGELIVRHSLEFALKKLGAEVKTAKSDQEFASCDLNYYDTIILDPWTWAAKGWVPKKNLIGHDSKIYLLDFFGSKGLRGKGLKVPLSRFLTAFGNTAGNTFLGYFINDRNSTDTIVRPGRVGSKGAKLQQGVVWGKDVKHYKGKEGLLKSVADSVRLVSTATHRLFQHDNIQWLGHQTPQSWLQLLASSKFLIGLGNPILGPSAIDAISVGCVYINPVFDRAALGGEVPSQHPFAARIGAPYVCSYREHSLSELRSCVDSALASDLNGYLPPEFELQNYMLRVQQIFGFS